MSIVEATESAPAESRVSPRPSLLSVLSVRDFRLVWVGQSISTLGDQFSIIALPWLTLQLTGSGVALGAVAAVGGIPRAIFMLVGGVFTDRFSPRSVMLVTNSIRIILTALLTVTVLTHTIQLWMLFVSSLLFGLVDAFFIPAQAAILPQLVDKDQFEGGNALSQITNQLAGFVGPALAGLLIASLSGAANIDTLTQSGKAASTEGIGAAFAVDTLTFVVAAVALWLMRGGRKVLEPDGRSGMLHSIGEGIKIVWGNPLMRTLVLVTAAVNMLFTGPMVIGLPVLAKTHFVEGAAAMGIILSAFGGGALLGALLAGALPTPRRVGITTMALIAFAGILLSSFGFVSSLPAAGVIGAVMAISVGYVNVYASSAIQKLVAPEAMGRVMSLLMLGSFGFMPISVMLAGFLVDINLSALFIGAGVLLVIISALSAANREVRAFVQGMPSAAG
jgi:MFS transporter